MSILGILSFYYAISMYTNLFQNIVLGNIIMYILDHDTKEYIHKPIASLKQGKKIS